MLDTNCLHFSVKFQGVFEGTLRSLTNQKLTRTVPTYNKNKQRYKKIQVNVGAKSNYLL